MKEIYIKILKEFMEEIENSSEIEARELWEMLGSIIIEPEKNIRTFTGSSLSDIFDVEGEK